MTGPLHRPYPPDLYRGNTGEVSGWIRPDDTEPEITYRSGGTCEYLATGDRTGTTFGLYRWTFGPDESGPDPHFHRAITESFYVLSGEVELYDGTGWKTGAPGDFFFVPEGGLHGFRGGNHASMLLMFTPRRAARGLLRDPRRPGREPDDRGGAGGVHAPPRHLLGLTAAIRRGQKPSGSRGPGTTATAIAVVAGTASTSPMLLAKERTSSSAISSVPSRSSGDRS